MSLDSDFSLKFKLEGNSKLGILLYAVFQTFQIVGDIVFSILKSFQLANYNLINASLGMVLVSIIMLVLTEEYREDEPVKVKINLGYLVVAQMLLSVAYGLGRSSVGAKIEQILGNQEILLSWSPNSPLHKFVSGYSRSQLDMYQEEQLKKHIVYLRCIQFFELVFNLIGVVWTIEILILNTGGEPDGDKKTHWYESDTNSLGSCVLITFSFILVFILIAFTAQLVQSARSVVIDETSLGWMPMKDQFDPKGQEPEHISYAIIRQERLLLKHVLLQNLTGKTAEVEGESLIDKGLYKFAQNRCYFDSLDSAQVLAN